MIIEQILITSLFTSGLYITTTEPYLLAWVRDWIGLLILDGYYEEDINGTCYIEFNQNWKYLIWKPLLGCLPCMASFWGIILYLIFNVITINSIYELPIILFGASAINYIVNRHMISKGVDY